MVAMTIAKNTTQQNKIEIAISVSVVKTIVLITKIECYFAISLILLSKMSVMSWEFWAIVGISCILILLLNLETAIKDKLRMENVGQDN